MTCMNLEYESYFERNPRHEGTVILSRTEEEIDRLIPQWIKIYRWPSNYKTGAMSERLRLRSDLRCPFKGGVISLSDKRANHFSQRDAKSSNASRKPSAWATLATWILGIWRSAIESFRSARRWPEWEAPWRL